MMITKISIWSGEEQSIDIPVTAQQIQQWRSGVNMTKYKIVRMYFNYSPETIKTDLTLSEAQQHCRDEESSSQTCKFDTNVAITEKYGEWFDSYERMTDGY